MNGGERIDVVEFSGFRLDRRERRLTDPRGAQIPLRPKVFDTLVLLVANAGRRVEKREIFEQVWPGIVVEENNLNQVISTLRRVLGDCRVAPRFIATVQGHGYRFVAPVRAAKGDTADEPASPARMPPSSAPTRLERFGYGSGSARRIAIGVAALALAAATIVAFFPRLLAPATESAATVAPPALPIPTLADLGPSVAVLPLADMAAREDQEFFADSLTDELIIRLRQIEGLGVPGRASAFQYKGHSKDLREIAEALGVANILVGSVHKSGDRLRITIELIRVADGYLLWMGSFNNNGDDSFAIQEDIARAVVEAVSTKLGVGALYPPDWETPRDEVAHDMYVRANGLLRASGKESLTRAEELFRDVIAHDPDFTAAQLGLANTLVRLAEFRPDRAVEVNEELAAILTRAVERAPNAALAYLLRAEQLWLQGDWRAAEAALRRAEQERPQDWLELEYRRAWMGAFVGRMSDAVESMSARVSADRLSLEASTLLQVVLHASGRLEEAEAEYERSLDLQGNRFGVEAHALARAIAEGYDRAIVHERAARATAAFPPSLTSPELLVSLLDDPEALLAELRRPLARAPDSAGRHPGETFVWADHVGDVDLALTALRDILDLYGTGGWVPWFGSNKHVRRHPAFRDIMREYGYEAYWRATGKWGDFCRPLGDDDFECW